ncbi:hypothetical protein PC129_g11095 [Phytophthora cactorum]|uniref:Uncharacterized protein n=1 Tax=Phytophthora cactorum TaxID=29920 RepID=A0A329S2I7_9STRA|nr:hypothetical protein Pcac1_g3926 [Phytophthora cactorum]KAG2820746.1 hypothetical protein PC112_g11650 [Phytophthora cactorum]KAG2822790.1 hypothetical protein PC111_g10488 [Phytophthora cactorum]KAG2854446.1 hypothetical protein PC113_g13299 [Phytophthora cactorum]KAG2902741.1 hypothetical protein PC114_g12597 [Phytophthora cactorum]
MSTSRYKAELVKLVSFKDDKKDDVGRNVTTEELLCITPDLLCRWMNKRAYGDPEPNEDMIPIHTRSSTLEIAKKAISAFMPRLNTKALPSHDVLQPTTTLSSAQSPARISVARLSKRPKDLIELWHEYQFGCSGIKPAKEFTPVERGASKFAYSRTKVFWDVITQLVRSGYTSDAAIDKVYQVYDRQLSVSSILVSLRADRRRGGHPSLR